MFHVVICTPWILFLSIVGIAHGQTPQIVNDILPDVQRVGMTARLNCTVAFLGKNTVQWAYIGKYDSYLISSNRDIRPLITKIGGVPDYEVRIIKTKDRTTFQLIISRIRPEYSGRYECKIVTPNVKDQSKISNRTSTLTVQYAPLIKPGSSSYVKMIERGANDSLYCDAHGVPAPNITWVRSDGFLLPNGKALSRGKSLIIKGADVKFTGLYRCVADNQIRPPAVALVQVYVFQEPKVRVLQDSVGQQANGRYESKLDCIVQGYPTPSVNWGYFEEAMFRWVTNSDKYETSKQTTDMQNLMSGEQWYTLRIRNIQASDFRKYYCVAKNYMGEANKTVVLFSTYDCQGPLCYSQEADHKGSAAISRLSPLVIILALSLVLGSRH